MKTFKQKNKRSKARARDSFTKRVGRFKFRKITYSDKSARYYFIFEGKTGRYVGYKKNPSSHVHYDFFLTFDKRQAQPFGFSSAINFMEIQFINEFRVIGHKPAFRIERAKF
jgi:hypothetical protein